MSEINLKQKLNVMTKLIHLGIDDEKKLLKLDIENILKIKGITITEMAIIVELQKSIKANRLYAYLGGDKDETNKEAPHHLEQS